jgi:Universal stress protein family
LLYVIQEILAPPQLYSYPLHELDKLTENYIKGLYQDLETKAMDMQKIDLIIMGSIGLRGINKIKTLGSVSRRVSEMASCPVLIVH